MNLNRLLKFCELIEWDNGCWSWTGRLRDNGYSPGYAMFNEGGKLKVASRVSYEHFIGGLKDGLQIHHICNNKKCVNPKHLMQVTAFENCHLSNTVAHLNSIKTHCKHGHEFTEDNIQRSGKYRLCKTCNRKRASDWAKLNKKGESQYGRIR